MLLKYNISTEMCTHADRSYGSQIILTSRYELSLSNHFIRADMSYGSQSIVYMQIAAMSLKSLYTCRYEIWLSNHCIHADRRYEIGAMVLKESSQYPTS